MSPSTDSSYIEIEAQSNSVDLKQGQRPLNVFRAIKMADMVDDLIRKFRPYSDDKKPSMNYAQAHGLIGKVVD